MHGESDPGDLAVGTLIAGKYRVERVIGRGGMGVVVSTTHVDLLEPRAIKLMLAWAAADAEMAQRFLREARIASRLKSQHVATVHDVGRLDNGVPYMVMEYLEGCDLLAVRKQRGPLPIEEAILYVIQACDALAEAHALGLVHRDIKPSNLFLTRGKDGAPSVKLLDFGISKFSDGGVSSGDDEMTKTGKVLGTPHYMPPEQMRGSRDIDARADIWALGVLLYVLLTGTYPYKAGNAVELISLVLTSDETPKPPSELRMDIPPQLGAIILSCLERDRLRRPPSVAHLASALLPFAMPSAGPLVDHIARVLAAPPSEPMSKSGSLLALSTPGVTSGSGGTSPRISTPPSQRAGLSGAISAAPLTLSGGTVTPTPRSTTLVTAAQPRRKAMLLWASVALGLTLGVAALLFATRRAPAVEPATAASADLPSASANTGAAAAASSSASAAAAASASAAPTALPASASASAAASQRARTIATPETGASAAGSLPVGAAPKKSLAGKRSPVPISTDDALRTGRHSF